MTKRNKLFYVTLYAFLFLCVFFIIRAFCVYSNGIRFTVMQQFRNRIIAFQSPAFQYMNGHGTTGGVDELAKDLIKDVLPIYRYSDGYPQTALSFEDEQMLEEILLSEGRDEYSDLDMNLKEEWQGEIKTRQTQEGKTESVQEQNEQNQQGQVQKEQVQTEEEQNETTPDNVEGKQQENSENPEQPENPGSSVLQMEPVQEVSIEELKDFKTLLSKYYVVDGTSVNEEQLNISKLLSYDMTLKSSNEQPQILIYHTHSQEGFADSDLQNQETTIVGAGEKLTNLLRGYGFNVIHDTGQYDVPERDNAYSVAAPAIEEILNKYPSIEVVIDLHRDGVADTTHLVTEINGKKMAQFMFLNGLSRTEKGGDIEYLKNENIDENLAFSFQAQMIANQYYPSLARKIYLKGYRFNMHYRGKYLLIELGAQTNTVEEIMNAVDPIAHILQMTLTKDS